jgi:hypothetical protein
MLNNEQHTASMNGDCILLSSLSISSLVYRHSLYCLYFNHSTPIKKSKSLPAKVLDLPLGLCHKLAVTV